MKLPREPKIDSKRVTIYICGSLWLNSAMISFLRLSLIHLFPKRYFCRRMSTIYALSSGYGKCGVAVIRISGPRASTCLFEIAGMRKLPSPRYATLRKIRDPRTYETLDHAIVIWFPGPKSFTGEDICELHVHGGVAVVSSILEALSKLNDYRPATPGEFTKRAFYAGKLDLLEVEGLGDLIQAETETQRKQALYQMEGTLSKLYATWRQSLLKCLAHVEAYIDFSEDENIEEDILLQIDRTIRTLIKDIKTHLADGRRGERLRDGVRAVIIGEPNVGKSSLLNLLCHQPAAIVSSIPGTTRDIVERPLNINGYPVLLSDTAGLRIGTDDPIEIEGVKRARECVANADLVLLVADAEAINKNISEKNCFEKAILSYIKELLIADILLNEKSDTDKVYNCNEIKGSSFTIQSSKASLKTNCIVILNKLDLLGDVSYMESMLQGENNVSMVSCKTNVGIPNFMDLLQKQLSILCANPSRENPSLTQSRHRHHLENCLSSLESYVSTFEESESSSNDCDVVTMVQNLRHAMHSLSKITGHVSADEILDVIFSDFCIGK